MTSETRPQTPPKPRRTLLATKGLVKSFGNFQVLRKLDLSVREGQVYGFLGRNGAGKTTTIQILMGIQRPDHGSIAYFGEQRRAPRVSDKQHIGYVSQEQFFYPWMSCRNLGQFVSRFYPNWDMAYFARLLDLFSLPSKRKVVNLSQGMRVKLALALALAHRPKILILDEPTAGLDPAARREFLDIVNDQAERDHRTTLFSSHIVEEVERIADRVGILREGSLCFQGSPEQLALEVRQIVLPDPLRPDAAQRLKALRRDAGHAGFHVLHENARNGSLVMRAQPDQWQQWLQGRSETQVKLSLEDIFLALTVDRGLRL
ncbi:ABC transporter ATP-binding protein [Acanthopleuribacter pedis]|uniref:ABC transporter ATP-binding protein n=1 Tax=Acanthopleuribacter pedis TaxID=442870 RepID=A0A8J7U352_9BACT|nr:ABC transporter ATP-binding protein [Acanthopleuribacter pedis]MBO1316911.1 ABC transporter ATP-binding protein [Acanthopleuribacter pedis]